MRKTLRHATVGVMVALGLAGVAPAASADQSEPLTIVLQVRDTAHVPDDVLTGAQAEVTAIFRQAGVQAVWRAFSSSSTNTDGSREPRITVAILSHDQAERLQSGLPRYALGLALNSSPTTRANVAYVFYERVRPLTGANGVTLAPVLAAAMAHEIGHLLLPPKAHSQTGLMRADWAKADLQLIQRIELFFTAEQGELIRRQITGAAAVSGEGIRGFTRVAGFDCVQWSDGI